MARRWAALVVVAALGGGCPKHTTRETVGADAGDGEPKLTHHSLVPAPPPRDPFGPEMTSLRLKRSIVVRNDPDESAKALGTIAQDTRVTWTSWSEGEGDCKTWIEIAPRGWVCDRYLEGTKRAPVGVELPKLKDGEILPGLYGKVNVEGAEIYKSPSDIEKKKPARNLAGAVKVRLVEQIEADNHLWWKTLEGEYILAREVTVLAPSTFAGVKLDAADAPQLPLAWAQSHVLGRRVAVRDAADGSQVKSLPPRAIVKVLETSKDGAWIRVGDKQWVAAADLHVARAADPPATIGDDERWFDVDLDQQVVVAYEGKTPAFATMVSSGNKKWPTAPGIYRIWIKFAETDMNGQMGDEAPYSVSTVPWTMFFAKDLAFHTAYWHDDFGEARSHGCLNLSPKDARTLYFWASPDVPPGWSMVNGIQERPGSAVRIRSKAAPDPEWKGYAKELYEKRSARPAGAPAHP